MRADGREFPSGSESPRRFTEVLAEREPLPSDRGDDAPMPEPAQTLQRRANKG